MLATGMATFVEAIPVIELDASVSPFTFIQVGQKVITRITHLALILPFELLNRNPLLPDKLAAQIW